MCFRSDICPRHRATHGSASKVISTRFEKTFVYGSTDKSYSLWTRHFISVYKSPRLQWQPGGCISSLGLSTEFVLTFLLCAALATLSFSICSSKEEGYWAIVLLSSVLAITLKNFLLVAEVL